MPRKPPVRTTKSVHLTLSATIAAKLREAAARLGLTASEYVAVLVNGQTPIGRPGAQCRTSPLPAIESCARLAYSKRNPTSPKRFDCCAMRNDRSPLSSGRRNQNMRTPLPSRLPTTRGVTDSKKARHQPGYSRLGLLLPPDNSELALNEIRDLGASSIRLRSKGLLNG